MAKSPKLNAQILHRIGVERFATGVIRKIAAILDKAEADIERKLLKWLASHDTEAGYGAATRRQLEKLLAEIKKINVAAHRAMYKGTRKELVDLAKSEGEFAKTLAATQATIGVKFNVPTSRLLEAAVDNKPFQGRLLKTWFDDLSASSQKRISDAVTMGLVQGESMDQIVKRVSGTKSLSYKDGAFAVSRRMLEAAVRTATASAHNEAHEAFAKENPDLFEGVRWITTLDSRACLACAELAGEIFPVDEGPRPPRHLNCRCVIETIPVGSPVEAEPTYENWLSEQDEETQRDTLGDARYTLWKSGGVPLGSFSVDGKALTLDELKQRDYAAWVRLWPEKL